MHFQDHVSVSHALLNLSRTLGAKFQGLEKAVNITHEPTSFPQAVLDFTIGTLALYLSGIASHRIYKKAAHRRFRRTRKIDNSLAVVSCTFYDPQEDGTYYQRIRNHNEINLSLIFTHQHLGEIAIEYVQKAMRKCNPENPSVFQHLDTVKTDPKIKEYIVKSWVNFFSGFLNQNNYIVGLLAEDKQKSIGPYTPDNLEETIYPILTYEPTSRGIIQPKILFLHDAQLEPDYYQGKRPELLVLGDQVYHDNVKSNELHPHAKRVQTMGNLADNFVNGIDPLIVKLAVKVRPPKEPPLIRVQRRRAKPMPKRGAHSRLILISKGTPSFEGPRKPLIYPHG